MRMKEDKTIEEESLERRFFRTPQAITKGQAETWAMAQIMKALKNDGLYEII